MPKNIKTKYTNNMNKLKIKILEYLIEHSFTDANTIAKALKVDRTDVKKALAILDYEGKVRILDKEMAGNFEVRYIFKNKKRVS